MTIKSDRDEMDVFCFDVKIIPRLYMGCKDNLDEDEDDDEVIGILDEASQSSG